MGPYCFFPLNAFLLSLPNSSTHLLRCHLRKPSSRKPFLCYTKVPWAPHHLLQEAFLVLSGSEPLPPLLVLIPTSLMEWWELLGWNLTQAWLAGFKGACALGGLQPWLLSCSWWAGWRWLGLLTGSACPGDEALFWMLPRNGPQDRPSERLCRARTYFCPSCRNCSSSSAGRDIRSVSYLSAC